MAEARMGAKVRRLRQEQNLTQAQMAEQLGISGSYLNLIESNQRPLTVPVLLKLAQRFSINIDMFNAEDDGQLLDDLMEAFADPLFDAHGIKAADLKELVSVAPSIGKGLLALYRATRGSHAAARAPESSDENGMLELPSGMPSEEVSDFIEQHGNHFAVLETAAQALWSAHGLTLATLPQDLTRILSERYAIELAILPATTMGHLLREYRPLQRRLCLSELLPLSSRTFQLAHQIALLGARDEIDKLAAKGKFTTDEADLLARQALANYFASAVMMPYDRFREEARACRHDLEVLEHRFGASFEQVCHRLTTLRRPGAEGVPFHFIRVDIAGNISKRFSASGIRIARFGAACPRWNVYDAFATPGMLRVQVSQMPDGAAFFCVARTIAPAGRPATRGPFGPRVSQLAIGLGCPVAYAGEIGYADGVKLDDPASMNPIGVSCRICERTTCVDRAMPALHHKLEIDENRRGVSAYTLTNR